MSFSIAGCAFFPTIKPVSMKEFKKAINDFMKEQDFDDIEEYAQWFYDLRIDQYKNGSNVIEATEPSESEIVETEPDETDIDGMEQSKNVITHVVVIMSWFLIWYAPWGKWLHRR